MAARQWIHHNKVVEAIVAASLGDAAVNINGVAQDIVNYESIAAVVRFGVIAATAVTSIVFQGSDDLAFTNPVTYDETKVMVKPDDDGNLAIIEAYLSKHRYVRLQVGRATANADVKDALYILNRPQNVPVEQVDQDLARVAIHPGY